VPKHRKEKAKKVQSLLGQFEANSPYRLDIAVCAAGPQLGANIADVDGDGFVLHGSAT
jgi:hypothetical protein